MYVLQKGGHDYTDVGRIYIAVWGASDPPNDDCLRAHFSHIRSKISDLGIQIESAGVRGGGMHKYRLRLGE